MLGDISYRVNKKIYDIWNPNSNMKASEVFTSRA